MKELDDLLQHAGVKGMKWGVIRWRKPGGESGQTRNRPRNRMRQEWDSMKRERHWKKVMKDFDKLTTKEIGTVARRAQLENELKKLSKTKIATKKDKADYRLREKMSDQELNRKVGRLRAKHALSTQYDTATKEQRDFGMRVVQTGGSLLIKMAMDKKLTPGEIYDSISDPKAAQRQAIKSLLDVVLDRGKKK